MSRCKEEIVKQIEYIEGNQSKTVSPVSFALDYISATRDGNPESKAIMNMSTQIELLSSKVAELESRLPGIKVPTFWSKSFLEQIIKAEWSRMESSRAQPLKQDG